MNYDTRMEICRRIRRLEYDASGIDEVKRDIASSTEFTNDEKDFLYFCADKFLASLEVKQGFSKNLLKILPYGLAAAAGYGVRVAQEKFAKYVEEGKTKAREDFANKEDIAKTSS